MELAGLEPATSWVESVTFAPDLRLEEIVVVPDSWLAGKALREVGAAHPGVRVLAVKRGDGGELVASPSADVALAPGDLAVVLGPADALQMLG